MNRCRGFGCGQSLPHGQRYCAKCLPKAQEKYRLYTGLYDRVRNTDDYEKQFRKFYASKEWKEKREEILSRNITCPCKKAFASHVHHIVPLKENWDLRLTDSNLMALCASCHSSHELKEKNRQRRRKKS